MPRALVTGGTGFVGTHLTRNLLRMGFEVFVTQFDLQEPIPEGAQLVEVDSSFIPKPGFECDVVFHQAANNDTLCLDETAMMSANYYWPINLLETMAFRGCKAFIYASSTAVYGKQEGEFSEESPLLPVNPYGVSKAKFDHFVLNEFSKRGLGIRTVGLRYSNIYGPGEGRKGPRMSMIGKMLRCAIEKRPIELFEGTENCVREWIYVLDVVTANICAFTSYSSGIYNICGFRASFSELIELVRNHFPLEVQTIPCLIEERYQRQVLSSVQKAHDELEWYPEVNLKAGIADYAEFLRVHKLNFKALVKYGTTNLFD